MKYQFVKILFNFKKQILAWIKSNLKTLLIFVKNQEFKLITSCHLKNLISPKPTWSSQWSLMSSRNLAKAIASLSYFAHISDFFKKKKRFLRKSSKTGWTWESSSNYLNCSSWTFKVELQLWWYKNLFSSSLLSVTKVFCQCSLTVTYHGFSRLDRC